MHFRLSSSPEANLGLTKLGTHHNGDAINKAMTNLNIDVRAAATAYDAPELNSNAEHIQLQSRNKCTI